MYVHNMDILSLFHFPRFHLRSLISLEGLYSMICHCFVYINQMEHVTIINNLHVLTYTYSRYQQHKVSLEFSVMIMSSCITYTLICTGTNLYILVLLVTLFAYTCWNIV